MYAQKLNSKLHQKREERLKVRTKNQQQYAAAWRRKPLLLLLLLLLLIHIPQFTAVQLVLTTVRSHWPSTSYSVLPKAFCIRIYRAGWRSGSLKLSCNLFGIIPAVDITSGITQAVFSCHIVISSSFKSGASRWWCYEGCDCWALLHLLSVLVGWFCQV
jgi:hypothetical protein